MPDENVVEIKFTGADAGVTQAAQQATAAINQVKQATRDFSTSTAEQKAAQQAAVESSRQLMAVMTQLDALVQKHKISVQQMNDALQQFQRTGLSAGQSIEGFVQSITKVGAATDKADKPAKEASLSMMGFGRAASMASMSLTTGLDPALQRLAFSFREMAYLGPLMGSALGVAAVGGIVAATTVLSVLLISMEKAADTEAKISVAFREFDTKSFQSQIKAANLELEKTIKLADQGFLGKIFAGLKSVFEPDAVEKLTKQVQAALDSAVPHIQEGQAKIAESQAKIREEATKSIGSFAELYKAVQGGQAFDPIQRAADRFHAFAASVREGTAEHEKFLKAVMQQRVAQDPLINFNIEAAAISENAARQRQAQAAEIATSPIGGITGFESLGVVGMPSKEALATSDMEARRNLSERVRRQNALHQQYVDEYTTGVGQRTEADRERIRTANEAWLKATDPLATLVEEAARLRLSAPAGGSLQQILQQVAAKRGADAQQAFLDGLQDTLDPTKAASRTTALFKEFLTVGLVPNEADIESILADEVKQKQVALANKAAKAAANAIPGVMEEIVRRFDEDAVNTAKKLVVPGFAGGVVTTTLRRWFDLGMTGSAQGTPEDVAAATAQAGQDQTEKVFSEWLKQWLVSTGAAATLAIQKHQKELDAIAVQLAEATDPSGVIAKALQMVQKAGAGGFFTDDPTGVQEQQYRRRAVRVSGFDKSLADAKTQFTALDLPGLEKTVKEQAIVLVEKLRSLSPEGVIPDPSNMDPLDPNSYFSLLLKVGRNLMGQGTLQAQRAKAQAQAESPTQAALLLKDDVDKAVQKYRDLGGTVTEAFEEGVRAAATIKQQDELFKASLAQLLPSAAAFETAKKKMSDKARDLGADIPASVIAGTVAAQRSSEVSKMWQEAFTAPITEAIDKAQTAAMDAGRSVGDQFRAGFTAAALTLSKDIGTFGQQMEKFFRGVGDSMTRGLDDTFFDLVTGKFSDLGKAAQQAGLAIVREFTGALARLSLKPLFDQLGLSSVSAPTVGAGAAGGGGILSLLLGGARAASAAGPLGPVNTIPLEAMFPSPSIIGQIFGSNVLGAAPGTFLSFPAASSEATMEALSTLGQGFTLGRGGTAALVSQAGTGGSVGGLLTSGALSGAFMLAGGAAGFASGIMQAIQAHGNLMQAGLAGITGGLGVAGIGAGLVALGVAIPPLAIAIAAVVAALALFGGGALFGDRRARETATTRRELEDANARLRAIMGNVGSISADPDSIARARGALNDLIILRRQMEMRRDEISTYRTRGDWDAQITQVSKQIDALRGDIDRASSALVAQVLSNNADKLTLEDAQNLSRILQGSGEPPASQGVWDVLNAIRGDNLAIIQSNPDLKQKALDLLQRIQDQRNAELSAPGSAQLVVTDQPSGGVARQLVATGSAIALEQRFREARDRATFAEIFVDQLQDPALAERLLRSLIGAASLIDLRLTPVGLARERGLTLGQ